MHTSSSFAVKTYFTVSAFSSPLVVYFFIGIVSCSGIEKIPIKLVSKRKKGKKKKRNNNIVIMIKIQVIIIYYSYTRSGNFVFYDLFLFWTFY